MNQTQPIRNKHQVRQLINHYRRLGQLRNYVLITLCIHTALRISDILSLSYEDLYTQNNTPKASITLTEKKTGKTKTIALHKNIIQALKLYRRHAKPGKAIILNRCTGKAISRIQAYRIIRTAAEALNIHNPVSCHSLRKTFGYHAWQRGISPAILMEIYNHSSQATTRRYLGVNQDDMNQVYHLLTF